MNRRRILLALGLFGAALVGLQHLSLAQFQGGQGGQGVQGGRGSDSRINLPAGAQLPGGSAAASNSADPSQPPPMETDLVLLTVSVTAPVKSEVPKLARERFEVFEDGVPQKISYFWQDSRPVTVGLLLDDSDYMNVNHKMEDIRDVVPAFLKSKLPEDEYFVVQFSTNPRMTVSYTTDAKQGLITFPGGGKDDSVPDTALSDAIYLGLEAIKEAANARKALLVITAGGDKGCDGRMLTLQPEQLLNFALKQPVQIYSMLIADDSGSPCPQIEIDANNLDLLAGVTGGQAYLTANASGAVEAIAAEVARGLKTQFLIGFKSTNTAKDGKRRGVKVKVNPPEGSPKLKVWTKAAYYAPKAK